MAFAVVTLRQVSKVVTLGGCTHKQRPSARQIEHAEGGAKRDWYAPIVADAEAGFGGPLNCFEMMKAMIKAGAAGVHFEDQLSSEKKCGHLGGKVRGLAGGGRVPVWAAAWGLRDSMAGHV